MVMRCQLLLILFICICSGPISLAQNTVGLISSDEQQISAGYNLIFSHNQEKVFLLDNKGQIVHFWDDENDFRPGNSVYLLPNGHLVKCKRPKSFADDAIWAGGGGAMVEIVDWEGNELQSFELNNDNFRLHHDVAPMSNGNVLMIAWSKVDSLSAAEQGRDPSLITQAQVWSEKILEWDPSSNQVVWEWDVFDHLVQDRFSNLDNFGDVKESRHKIDINYDEHDGHPDWLHINSIDYNEVLDQIVLSVPYFNELWVIDHSTTTEEAATGQGGNSGLGGDLVYRWGNPKTTDMNSSAEQRLYFQHDIHWVDPYAEEGSADFGKMLIYNNRLPNETSEGMLINTINPETGSYYLDDLAADDAVIETYQHPNNSSLSYSTGLSSIQRLNNGNILTLAGRWGYAYEITSDNSLVWEYRIPFNAGKVVPQGTDLGLNNNITFRMKRYPIDYGAFEGKDLSPQGLLEEFDDSDEVVTSIEKQNFSDSFDVYPNPANGRVTLKIPSGFVNNALTLEIIDVGTSKTFHMTDMVANQEIITLEESILAVGLNLVKITNETGFAIKKVIRLD
jgi:hypothetical protein